MAKKGFNLRRQPGFGLITAITFAVLYLPILALVVFSFNAGSAVSALEGLSLRWYAAASANAEVQEATLRSLLIASVATIVSTSVAVAAALPLTRGQNFRGRTLVFTMINQPLMVPEIVTAVALLIVFAAIKVQTG